MNVQKKKKVISLLKVVEVVEDETRYSDIRSKKIDFSNFFFFFLFAVIPSMVPLALDSSID